MSNRMFANTAEARKRDGVTNILGLQKVFDDRRRAHHLAWLEPIFSSHIPNLPEICRHRLRRIFRCDRQRQTHLEEHAMSTIVVVILILLLIGALPTWPYSRGWGYYPSGGLGLIVLILLVLALTGRV